MADDPLYAPLGLTRVPPRRSRRVPGLASAGLLVLVAAAVAAVYLKEGTPKESAVAVAAIEAAPTRVEVSPPVPAAAAALPPVAAEPPGSTVEIQNGVKIVRLNPTGSAASVTLPVGSESSAPLAAAPDPRVSELSPDGPLPRIGKDGRKPSAVYGRPTLSVEGPRLALVAVGIGYDQPGAAAAARTLPAAVDFAFPPDAPDAATQVAEVRRAGREVVLDLGAGVDGAAVRPALARWSGYVGVRLPEGADAAVREANARGVLAVRPVGDGEAGADGSADASDPVAFRAALDRLAGIARAKGSAIGLIQNAVAGRDVVARAVAELSAQGVTLVPLSAAGPLPTTAAAR